MIQRKTRKWSLGRAKETAEVPGLLMAENKAFKLDNMIMTNLIVNLLFVTWSLAIADTQRTSEHCTASGRINRTSDENIQRWPGSLDPLAVLCFTVVQRMILERWPLNV